MLNAYEVDKLLYSSLVRSTNEAVSMLTWAQTDHKFLAMDLPLYCVH